MGGLDIYNNRCHLRYAHSAPTLPGFTPPHDVANPSSAITSVHVNNAYDVECWVYSSDENNLGDCPFPYSSSGTLSTDNYVKGNLWYELGESIQTSMSDCADVCTATVGCASFSYGGETGIIQYKEQYQSCRLYKIAYSNTNYGDNTRFCVNTDVAPVCTGCGNRERECWDVCQGEGICEACDSAGRQGACCRKGLNSGVHSHCATRVNDNWFITDAWHQCVILD